MCVCRNGEDVGMHIYGSMSSTFRLHMRCVCIHICMYEEMLKMWIYTYGSMSSTSRMHKRCVYIDICIYEKM